MPGENPASLNDVGGGRMGRGREDGEGEQEMV